MDDQLSDDQKQLPQPAEIESIETRPVGGSSINQSAQNSKIGLYIGRGIKLMAIFAVVGCLLLYFAITAISTIIGNALPH